MSELNKPGRQVSGTHYQPKVGNLMHWDWVTDNGLSYLEGGATKYLCRCNLKNPDPEEDLEKSIHYVEKLVEKVELGVIKPRHYTNGSIVGGGVKDICTAYDLDDEVYEFMFRIFYWTDVRELKELVGYLKEYKNKKSKAKNQ